MTIESRRITLGWPTAVAMMAALVGGGAAAALWWTKSVAPVPAPAASVASQPAAPAAAPPSPHADARITLGAEMSSRAGIEVRPVIATTQTGELRIPGLVQPDAYHQVIVTSLVPGRVTRVRAALGDRVARGQTLAQIFSPEMAEARTAFAARRAEVEAGTSQLKRTERLVEIGAASRQELEQVQAEHTRHTTELESARARLTLLGVPVPPAERSGHATQISAETAIPAPIAGVVTARSVNAGLNVDTATPLFTIVDLSRVWIEGDLYEKDFAGVHTGSSATITTAAYPGVVMEGKVSYIDPQVRPETRTAKLRVEVPNRDGRLKLGMFADISVRTGSTRAVLAVPPSALQTVGDRQVVYLVDAAHQGQFIEREVQAGERDGDRVQIVSGLAAGDVVVTKGTFFLRAERERAGSLTASTGSQISASGSAAPRVQTARVEVTDKGFEPQTVSLKAGMPARLTFVRRSDRTCATEVLIPSQNLRRALPLNQEVVIAFTPGAAGEMAFTCGMNMLKGTVVVQ